ncbi:MAG: DUF4912 domain-containing protein, partial [Nitrospinaceae bacterium]|nr:DUF4912 domain-containing protein [Nitrospinaceae bacterium]NIR57200.1 DUF4912 domain-containing protein [Nitrospinaceae bacterium]NIS87643.1 DUF4912 domain-containing protein [Nitrospinaceae bacterium]NIT84510.1 DUF4912 domain-containing protein [Nitrospinaceae bacterium]NIU46700.1 DUF4912 domain-containing protein [Nitrospinaceae bacterium]
MSPDTLHPPFELEDMAREAKFIVGGPGLGDEARTEGAPELPRGYGDNTLVLMPRDPYWAYVYWEIQPSKLEQGLESLNRRRQEVRPVLRLHSVPEVMGRPFDVDVDLDTGYHYMQLSPPGSTFYAELGLRDPEGRFLVLLHSNEATMPLDGPSEVADEEWMTSETEFQEMYALSGGFAPYLSGSEALGQRFRVSQDVSAWSPGAAVSSWSAGISSGASHPPATLKKGQNMALEAELVLYGTARPGATVKVNDR